MCYYKLIMWAVKWHAEEPLGHCFLDFIALGAALRKWKVFQG
jgi:hypothetical protein